MPSTIRHKILLVTLVCALVILGGFTAVVLITRQQHQLVQKHLELPFVFQSWFRLTEGLHHSLLLQLQGIGGNVKYPANWETVWIEDLEPAMLELEKLYSKERIWDNERQVESKTFYDIRLMLRQLKDMQRQVSMQSPGQETSKVGTADLLSPIWTSEVTPLLDEISGSIEHIIRWQTDFSRLQNEKLRSRLLELTIRIWIIAFAVLMLLVLLAWFLTLQITMPLKELRDTVRRIKDERFRGEISHISNDEVGELAQEFREMMDTIRERAGELRESNRLFAEASHQKGMFLTSMSHELRTPLNAIIGFAEALLENEEEPLSHYRRDRISRILQSGQQLLQLINSLLDLSRLEAGQMPLSNSKLNLDELVLEVIQMLEPLIQEKSLEFSHRFSTGETEPQKGQENDEKNLENPFQINADIAKLRQVLVNLIGNAIKFTDHGGRILILLNRLGDKCRVQIEDNGCGIEKDQLCSIFDVFSQASSATKRSGEGTGFGLALVKSLVELMGGTITVNSYPGRGSLFSIEIPVLHLGSREPELKQNLS